MRHIATKNQLHRDQVLVVNILYEYLMEKVEHPVSKL